MAKDRRSASAAETGEGEGKVGEKVGKVCRVAAMYRELLLTISHVIFVIL